MDCDPGTEIELLRSELRQGRHVRSSVGAWMFRNHAAFAALLLEEGVDWERLAAGFARLGLTDATGKPPQAGTVKITWRRVQAALEREGIAVRRRRRSGKNRGLPAALRPGPAEPPAGPDATKGGSSIEAAASADRFRPVRKRTPEAQRAVTPKEQQDLCVLRARVFGTEVE